MYWEIITATIFNVGLWAYFFWWLYKPERKRRRIEKLLRQSE
jgi:hypothetical protein